MPVMRATALVIFISSVLAAVTALAQPQPESKPQPTPPAPSSAEPSPAAPAPQVNPEPASTPTPEAAPKVDVGSLLAKAHASYRKGVVAEHVTFRVSWPDGREAKSTVTFLLDNGVPALDWPRRLKLELGRLTIAADDRELVVINSQDSGTYFGAQLPEGLTLAALHGVLPPIPLPQLEWALSDSDASPDISKAIPGAGTVQWSEETSESRSHQFTFNGDAGGNGVQLTIDSSTGSLVRMSGPFGPKGVAGQARLDIDVVQIPPAQVPTADHWAISTAGRVPVGFLAELKGRAPEVVAGDRLPALSLMTLDLDSASLQDVLQHSDGPKTAAPSARPPIGMLLLYRVQDSPPSDDAKAGVKAIADLKPLVASRFPDIARRPRLVGLIVASMDLQEFTRTRLTDVDKEWGKDAAAPQRAFSPTGNAILQRLANKASAALIIVDGDQRVLKAISLDGRAAEDAAIAQEALSAIMESLGPLP
jgi:hypothetical protein